MQLVVMTLVYSYPYTCLIKCQLFVHVRCIIQLVNVLQKLESHNSKQRCSRNEDLKPPQRMPISLSAIGWTHRFLDQEHLH